MKRLENKFKALNYVDLLTCKYLEASIDAELNKKDSSRLQKYVEMLKFTSDYIKDLDNDFNVQCKHSLELTRVVAIQEQEIRILKDKLNRLEKHYETKGL
jgi:hypothetical protein